MMKNNGKPLNYHELLAFPWFALDFLLCSVFVGSPFGFPELGDGTTSCEFDQIIVILLVVLTVTPSKFDAVKLDWGYAITSFSYSRICHRI